MSTRRGFLKLSLTLIAGASVAPSILLRATEHVQKYHPEVQAVFDNFGDTLEPHEKQAIAKFVLDEMENGNWDAIDSFSSFGFEDEEKRKINWK